MNNIITMSNPYYKSPTHLSKLTVQWPLFNNTKSFHPSLDALGIELPTVAMHFGRPCFQGCPLVTLKTAPIWLIIAYVFCRYCLHFIYIARYEYIYIYGFKEYKKTYMYKSFMSQYPKNITLHFILAILKDNAKPPTPTPPPPNPHTIPQKYISGG